jgi:hypothetical protein
LLLLLPLLLLRLLQLLLCTGIQAWRVGAEVDL